MSPNDLEGKIRFSMQLFSCKASDFVLIKLPENHKAYILKSPLENFVSL